jgi:hypothetical protein
MSEGGAIVTADSASRKTGRPLWVILLLILAASSAAFVWRGAEQALRMQTGMAGESQVAHLKPLQAAAVVVEVAQTAGNELHGHLLEKQDDTHYSREPEEATIRWNATTRIVMGQAADVRPGAVLHVTGTVANDRGVDARQVVILTGYVKVR